MKYILAALLISVTSAATAQKAVFKWTDELCSYESVYDTKKITKQQVNNCYRLVWKEEFNVTVTPSVFTPEDMDKPQEPEKLEAEFTRANTTLKSLDLPKTPFWEGFKAAKLKEQQQRYEFYRTSFKAYKNVNALKEYQSKNPDAQLHAKALMAGGDALLEDWAKVRKAMAMRNSDPAGSLADYKRQLASPDKLRYAFVDVMNFGWHNAANHAIEAAADVYPSETVHKEWEKLFVNTKTIHCDEP